ncbi:nuclear transport factor 2 family protein [Phenylobacterium sp.]|uniref:nuclear transport factor 2 family protein n=1 Tax=Phenylobacterium sp. TaxID=1871053 RepID=UPI0025E051A6|nr:nuclear transport factor 2 family protein [Phenylobacterium sp.]
MRPRLILSVLAALTALSAPAAALAAAPPPEPRTEAAVLAASDDWLAAERRGDVAALDRRLMPQYQDIEPNGRVHPRAALIAHAANLKDPSTVPAKQLAAEFRKAHPEVEKVVMTGDTALISYRAPETEEQVSSVDIFVYDQGRWRALVSTHNSHG